MRPHKRALLSVALTLVAGTAAAQNTVPHWSTYFGGAGQDEGVIVRRGPGAFVTLVGHTTSTTLATQGPPYAGNTDAFVARFDPTKPPGLQLLWCTYLGGTGMELVFDAEVDPKTGVTTLVGLTTSMNFPAPQTLNGPSDGFVAQLNAQGMLIFSTLCGGASEDRVSEVEIAPNNDLIIAGITSSAGLGTAGTCGPTYRGGVNDAFVARILPLGQGTILWSTYLGGSAAEGWTLAFWTTQTNSWAGNLDRMALALDSTGNPVLATASYLSTGLPALTGNAFQPGYRGGYDVYVAQLSPSGGLLYGTLFGGSYDDNPRAVAVHPGGGFTFGGLTNSNDLPVSAGCYQPMPPSPVNVGDGFLAWIAPAVGLSYGTYLGSSAGQDFVGAIAVESSGVVTVAGMTAGGNFPVTPRCLQPTPPAPASFFGFVARLELSNKLASDLHHSSFVGGSTYFTSVVLDDLGDAYLAGTTTSATYPVMSPNQMSAGGKDAVITHMPLLPGGVPGVCVARQQLAFATPACGTPPVPLHTGMAQAPIPGTTFGITATNAPPLSPGVVVIGTPILPPQPILNAWLLVNPLLTVNLTSDRFGYSRFDLAVPPALPPALCWGLSAEWVFLTKAACPGTGMLSTSERLDL